MESFGGNKTKDKHDRKRKLRSRIPWEENLRFINNYFI